MMSKRQHQSCYVEPCKSDIPQSNFCKFFYLKYGVQLLAFLKSYSENCKIPHGFAWNPLNVNQGKSNDVYMKLELVLLSIFVLHHKYNKLNFSIFDIVKNMLCWGMCSLVNGIQLKYPITARVIKYCKFNNGGSNAFKVASGDFGFVKYGTKNCNKYGRLTAVLFVIECVKFLTV